MEENKLELFNEMFENKFVRIYGDFENPLFVANDIGDILEIKNIRDSIKNYKIDEVLKGVGISDTLSNGGYSNVNMLTEKGLYKLMYKSHSKIADKFQDFVYNLLHNLRTKKISMIESKLNEQNKLIEEQKILIEEQNKKIIDPKTMFYEKMKNRIKITNDQCYLYIFSSKENEDKNLFKIGITEESIKKRLSSLNTSISIESQRIYKKHYIKLNKDVYKHFESIFHSYLNQFQSEGEWFFIDFIKLKKLLNMTKRFADKFVEIINE